MEHPVVFAWTQIGAIRPGYISLDTSPMGGYDLIVRGPGSDHPQTLAIPQSQVERLTRALAAHLGLKISA